MTTERTPQVIEERRITRREIMDTSSLIVFEWGVRLWARQHLEKARWIISFEDYETGDFVYRVLSQ